MFIHSLLTFKLTASNDIEAIVSLHEWNRGGLDVLLCTDKYLGAAPFNYFMSYPWRETCVCVT